MSTVTFFKDETAKRKYEYDLTLDELIENLQSAHAPIKEKLPWTKLSLFGTKKTISGSLRHDANVIACTGVELDYDGERMTIEEAAAKLTAAGVECLLYESPSSEPGRPRWRVMAFLSRPITLTPAEREEYDRPEEELKNRKNKHVKYIDDILGGVAAIESYKLSQSYYYGCVDGTPPRKIIKVEGTRVDLLNTEVNPFLSYSAPAGGMDADERLAAMEYRAEGDAGIHATQLAVTASLLNAGSSEDEVVEKVLEATRRAAPSGWDWSREERTIRGMCRTWSRRLQLEEQQVRAQVISLDQARPERDWMAQLDRKSGRGRKIKAVHKNVVLFLENHEAWNGVLGYDDFAMVVVVKQRPPWIGANGAEWKPRTWTDADELHALDWFQHHGIEDASLTLVALAAIHVASDNRFHPVREYLDSLTWDGVARLDDWTADYLGAARNEFVRQASANTLVAAVARVRHPGCKADTILILEGEQGTFKSTAVRKLFQPWFTDEIADFGTKDASMQMRGAWCVEVSELDAMARGDVSKVKAFATRQVDRFRPPYGKNVVEAPRQCVLIGTVNNYTYLKDETGNRRFWPVRTQKINVDGLVAAKAQLWAEADHRYKSTKVWWIEDPEILAMAEMEQAERYLSDSWEEPVSDYLAARTLGGDSTSSVGEILSEVLFVPIEEQSQIQQNRVVRILKHLKWERFKKRHLDGKFSWRYRPSFSWSVPTLPREDGLNRFLNYGESVARSIGQGEFR